MIIDAANYTCPGGHEINEDSFLCRSDKGIFIVADGLGGHSDGEKASGAAIDYFEANCLGGYTEARILALMDGANAQVLQYGDGGKTTVAAAFIENGNFIYSNVGDSRVYLFREGKIIAQTKDHSVCQASVDMGMMRFEDIRGSEDRSRLLKVLGGEETLALKKHYAPIPLQQGDAFLICSDGFWDYVYETEMEADLLKSGSADVWLKYMLKRHILRAQNKGDNYTAICGIVHMEPGDAAAAVPDPLPPTVAYQEDEEETEEQKPFPAKAVIIGVLAGLLIVAAIIIAAVLLNSSGSGVDTDTSSTPVETPDETSETTSDGEETTTSESEETTPSESEETTPSESEETTPSEDEVTTPAEGDVTTPSEGEVTTPAEGEEPVPPEGEEPVPPEGDEPLPPDGEGPIPPDGEGPMPPEGPPEGEGPEPANDVVPNIFRQL